MKIIYHCYGGAHSSIVAAAIHLGYLPEDRIPAADEIMNVPLFDKQNNSDHGKLFLMGRDDKGNEIFTAGFRTMGKDLPLILNDIAEVAGIKKDYYFLDTLSAVNLKMRIGGFLSRRLRLVSIGRPIVLRGVQDNYYKFVDLVKNMQKKANRMFQS